MPQLFKGSRLRMRLKQYTVQELLALSSRQEALLAAVPEVIMEVDNHKIYTWANQAGFAFFGDDVIGKEAAFYFEGEQQTYATVQSQIDSHQDLFYVESWQRRKDGEIRLLAWQCRVLKDETGNVTGFLSSGRDVTEQKREEERQRLQKIEERWLAIMQSTQDAILMIDPEGRVSSWNRAAEVMFGHTRVEAIGQDLHELIAPERFRPAFHTAYQKFRQTGQGAGVGKILDLEALRKDGQEISVQLSLSAIQMNDGWHALGLIRDITERKQADTEIQQYVSELAERNKELQDALSNIKQLAGMLPICASCKQIRDDSGYWHSVETYISKHSKAEFSHGICPECEKKAYEELDNLKNGKI